MIQAELFVRKNIFDKKALVTSKRKKQTASVKAMANTRHN